jgi:PIN domain nuclease of toxin-antitoxin system
VKVLLDTQAFLWWASGSDRLTEVAASVIEDPQTEVLVSVASAWEIAIKSALGRLELEIAPETYVPDRLRRHGFTALDIALDHALRAGTLPRHHGDPFDRMLVAQGQLEQAPIISRYDVETIW